MKVLIAAIRAVRNAGVSNILLGGTLSLGATLAIAPNPETIQATYTQAGSPVTIKLTIDAYSTPSDLATLSRAQPAFRFPRSRSFPLFHPPSSNATVMQAPRNSSATARFSIARATTIPPTHKAAVACATVRRPRPFWIPPRPAPALPLATLRSSTLTIA